MLNKTLARAHALVLSAGAAYVAFLFALTFEPVQRHLIYLHKVGIPYGANFDDPTRYGFAPGKVLPLNLTTPDGVRLGAWQVLPKTAYDAHVAAVGVPDTYFHGNAGSRAQSNRLRVAQMVSAMDSNFLIIDYRSFGDSDLVPPTEGGLVSDARTAWDYLISKGVRPGAITVMGQSLGTGVSTALVASLANEGTSPNALILVAPFSSIFALLSTYRLANLVPLLGPLRHVASVMAFFKPFLTTQFNTAEVIGAVTCPILILHAQDDNVIVHTHSKTLAGLLDHAHATEVSFEPLGGWGNVTRWARLGGGDVVLGEAVVGGHNNIGSTEVSAGLIREAIHGEAKAASRREPSVGGWENLDKA